MSNGDDQGIQLGGGGGPDPMSMMGGGGGESPPSLAMSSDDPQMGDAPEQGSATIHFHKHSHTKERNPGKPGTHKHHVHLKVHSIKFHPHKKAKVSQADLEAALAGGGPGGGEPDGDDQPPAAPPPPPQ